MIEIEPGKWEPLSDSREDSEVNRFFHSLGRAITKKRVDNKFLKANLKR